jgi:glutamine synthetase
VLADSAGRFATVAMADTCGLLRGRKLPVANLKGIAQNGMGMAPAPLARRHPGHDLIPHQAVQTLRYRTVAVIREPPGIDLSKMHEEIGAGAVEARIAAGEGLEPADQLVPHKTFVPRWSEGADCQSIRLHINLQDRARRPLFQDERQKNRVGRTICHFLGGLQAYIGQMTLIFQPTVNSYRRFAPGMTNSAHEFPTWTLTVSLTLGEPHA